MGASRSEKDSAQVAPEPQQVSGLPEPQQVSGLPEPRRVSRLRVFALWISARRRAWEPQPWSSSRLPGEPAFSP